MLRNSVTQAQARLATSPLASAHETRTIFVTDGGWRWKWLAMNADGALAISRPLTRAVVVNATDPVTGTVRNGQKIGGERQLGPLLAHEFTHGLIRRRYGELDALKFQQWKVEGYCEYVGGESSLSDREAEGLEASGTDHPALSYYHGRRKVSAIIARNGGSVDALFSSEP